MAYFNFDGNEGLGSVFDHDFDAERIIDELGSIVKVDEDYLAEHFILEGSIINDKIVGE